VSDTPQEIINLAKPFYPASMRSQIASDIEGILASGRLMFGPWLKKFEESFAHLTRRDHAIGVNTCTTALQIALTFADVAGKEVLVPAGSFITDANVVKFAGGTPVLVDINPETLAFDLADLERKVTPNTRAMIWVHLTGIIAHNYRELLNFAQAHNLFVIEDAAHAHGASVDRRHAGSFGDASTFSFYPTKVISSGTGGMLTTDNADLATFAREMRIFGKKEGSTEIIHHGSDWFLDEIRSCVGYHHTQTLDEQLARRRQLAAIYESLLGNQPGLRRLDIPNNVEPAWYQYSIFLEPGIDRDALSDALKTKYGIETKGIYLPLHQETIFKDLDSGDLSQTEETLLRSLCLPMHAGLSDEDVRRTVESLLAEIREQMA
jgi:perosamine synthetase